MLLQQSNNILINIFIFLDLSDILNVKLINKLLQNTIVNNKIFINRIFIERINYRLHKHNLNDDFVDILKQNKMIIGGSFILESLLDSNTSL